MKKKPKKFEPTPRFGWCWDLDFEPQKIREDPRGLFTKEQINIGDWVVVIPMPYMSNQAKARVRRLIKSYWWPAND